MNARGRVRDESDTTRTVPVCVFAVNNNVEV
jgi:hypothetical protein